MSSNFEPKTFEDLSSVIMNFSLIGRLYCEEIEGVVKTK